MNVNSNNTFAAIPSFNNFLDDPRTGFSNFRIYHDTSDCVTVDPTLILVAKKNLPGPTPIEPTPFPPLPPTPTPDCVYIIGPNNTQYSIDNSTNPNFIGRCGSNLCKGYDYRNYCDPEPPVDVQPNQGCSAVGGNMICGSGNGAGGLGGTGSSSSGSSGSSGGDD